MGHRYEIIHKKLSKKAWYYREFAEPPEGALVIGAWEPRVRDEFTKQNKLVAASKALDNIR